MKKQYLFGFALLLGLSSCQSDVADELVPSTTLTCDTVVTYSKTIQPLLNANCAGCHSGATASAGIHLENYSGVSKAAGSGLLLGVVSHAPGFTPMPLGGARLSDCKVEQIRRWIEAGAPND